MSFAFGDSAREVLEQIVRQPQFRAITTIPVVAPITIGLVLAAFLGFATSTYLWLQGWLPLAAMIAFNGVFIYVAFSPLHDATHRTVSSNRKFNDLIGTIACFALLPGITTRIYRYLHLEHHRYAGDPARDPDEPFVSAPKWALPFVLATPDVLWTLWYFRHWNERPPSERLEFVLGLCFYFVFHAFWLLSPYAWEFFIAWMIPQRIGLTIVTYFFAHIQHPEGVMWEHAPFQTTVYIKAHPLFRYLMLSQTEHCLHHLMPSVPLYRYHRAWEAGRYLFERQNIPVRGFFTAIENMVMPQDRSTTFRRATVAAFHDVADGVRAYELRPIEGESFPRFEAGAHIDIVIDEATIRQYSILNAPSDVDRYVVAVKRDDAGRGGSKLLHASVAEGATLSISEPRNNFPLNMAATSFVLVGGGIGLTPLLAMAHALHAASADFVLHLCARSRASLPFAETLDTLPFAQRIRIHLDDGDEAQKFDPARALGAARPGHELYVCGPTAFMDWVANEARTLQWPSTQIHSESFTPRARVKTVNEPFEVELARSGKVLTVGADEFLIDVLHRNKCGIPCSCTQGICGSCITPVLSGQPDHRDAILTDAERARNDQMCVCVSRAMPGTGRIVLDA